MFQQPTYGVHDSLESERFVNELAATPLLTLLEEQTLTREIVQLRQFRTTILEQCDETDNRTVRQGLSQALSNCEARLTMLTDQLFAANFRLVLEFAGKTQRMEYMDQVQWGCIGLLRAIEKFNPYFIDPSSGRTIKFSTYATYWIVQFIQRGSDQQESLIRFPVHARDILKRLARKHIQYLQIHGSAPSFDVLCRFAGFPPEVVGKIRRIAMVAETPYSLQATFQSQTSTNETVCFGDLLGDDDADIEKRFLLYERMEEIRSRVQIALEALATYIDPRSGMTPYVRHAQVLKLRFRIGEQYALDEDPCRTLEEVGRLMVDEKSPMGITRERTRQLQRVAVEWMKRHQPDLADLLRED